MSPEPTPSSARLLDECIDELLAGGDWHQRSARSDDAAVMAQLMPVAEQVLDLAHRSRSPGPGEPRRRIWRRISAAIGIRFDASRRFVAAGGLAGGLAPAI